ncbi:MAG: DUF2461 domain-containing protein, partial [Acidimicrobiia bacterium]
MAKRHFTPALFTFLRELEANNEKTWWDANKDRYQTAVRDPALDFIIDFGARLEKLSPHFVAEAKNTGGSLMRPYRDTRFSPDKTPYKTNVGIQFRHEAGKDIHAPGYYLHLEPGSCFAGVGLWHPETEVARTLRQAINDHPDAWAAATKVEGFTDTWSLDQDDDEMLKRVPPGLDSEHPHADDLRMKSFMAGTNLTQKQVTSTGFDEELAAMFARASRFTGFLCGALSVP